jgi:PAS domain-containing protein
MSVERRDGPAAVTAAEAGELLALPADVVRALADAGYLPPSELHKGTPRFAVGDLKAFQARLGEGSSDSIAGVPGWGLVFDGGDLDPDALLRVVEHRAADLAERTLDLLVAVFPEAAAFSAQQRDRFVDESRTRIEAIIALCTRGPSGDEPLEVDLADIGADAAHAGVPLPGILAVLRITRDLVVQTAIEAAEERGRQWGLALAVTLTRVLPAIDRLSDAVAQGYWEALVEIEAEGVERYRTVVDLTSDGIFELDDDGIVRYANPAAVELLGPLTGRVTDVVLPGVVPGAASTELVINGAAVRILQFEQLRDGVAAGWVAVVRREAPN